MRTPDATTVEQRKRDFREGDRVRAERFVLDEGLRIWPMPNSTIDWRVVRVADQEVKEVVAFGTFAGLQADYPAATPGINDNETVPPGTEGTVSHVDDFGSVGVKWDNGRSISATINDTIVNLSRSV